MKLKFWQFEYDFDKDDAKIVIPVLLLVIAVATTSFSPPLLIGVSVVYYMIYFFFDIWAKKIADAIPKPKLKCPKCRNSKVILQGYQNYKSDEHYPFYLCTKCGTTSILTQGGLLEI
jgi:DNA-directed RNA polymerase subunit RPC12/RpoP